MFALTLVWPQICIFIAEHSICGTKCLAHEVRVVLLVHMGHKTTASLVVLGGVGHQMDLQLVIVGRL